MIALSPSGERVGKGECAGPRPTGFAKVARVNATKPEQRWWRTLRARRFADVEFRRQKVTGSYTVDCAARNPMLGIGVDGDTHAGRDLADARRSSYLAQQGYRVIRFTNHDVMTNLEGVLDTLADLIPLPLSRPSSLTGRGL